MAVNEELEGIEIAPGCLVGRITSEHDFETVLVLFECI